MDENCGAHTRHTVVVDTKFSPLVDRQKAVFLSMGRPYPLPHRRSHALRMRANHLAPGPRMAVASSEEPGAGIRHRKSCL